MSDAADRVMERARRITIRRFASAADADREELAYWQQIPEAERALEAWRLSLELWHLTGGPPHEPGLCRSVARVRRR
jgi:hypothetical protein